MTSNYSTGPKQQQPHEGKKKKKKRFSVEKKGSVSVVLHISDAVGGEKKNQFYHLFIFAKEEIHGRGSPVTCPPLPPPSEDETGAAVAPVSDSNCVDKQLQIL